MYFKKYISLGVICLYSFFFIQKHGYVSYIPIVLDRKLVNIPVKRKPITFFLINDQDLSDNQLDKRAISFLTRYTCKLDIKRKINVFCLKDYKEKSVTMSDL